MDYLDENEIIFWKRLIGRYLLPHAHSDETKAALKVSTLFWIEYCSDDIVFVVLLSESTFSPNHLLSNYMYKTIRGKGMLFVIFEKVL